MVGSTFLNGDLFRSKFISKHHTWDFHTFPNVKFQPFIATKCICCHIFWKHRVLFGGPQDLGVRFLKADIHV